MCRRELQTLTLFETKLSHSNILLDNGPNVVKKQCGGFPSKKGPCFRSENVNLYTLFKSQDPERHPLFIRCTDSPSLQEKLGKGPLLRFFLRGGGSVHRLYPVERHTSTRGVHATETGCPLPVLTLLLFRHHIAAISLLFNFAASHFLEAKVLEVPSLMVLL